MSKKDVWTEIDDDVAGLVMTGAGFYMVEEWKEKYVILCKEEYQDLQSELNYHKMAAKAMSKLLGNADQSKFQERINELENAISFAINRQSLSASYEAQKSAILKLRELLK